jgi:hypothetical protein
VTIVKSILDKLETRFKPVWNLRRVTTIHPV